MKRKKLVQEFKTFISRGSVIDLSVGVIVGGAFQAIINSLVGDLLMPLIGSLTGGIDFSNKFLLLHDSHGAAYSTLAEAKAGGAVFAYGAFLTAVINFLLMALAVFTLVKIINTVREKSKKPEVEPEPPREPVPELETKECPFCFSSVDSRAIKCPRCTSSIQSAF